MRGQFYKERYWVVVFVQHISHRTNRNELAASALPRTENTITSRKSKLRWVMIFTRDRTTSGTKGSPSMKTYLLFSCSLQSRENSCLGADSELNTILDRYPLTGVIRSAVGVTRQGTAIPCFIGEDHFDPETEKFRILIVGGLDGSEASVDQAMSALSEFQGETELQKRYTVSCVPCARPDAMGQGKSLKPGFPPDGNAYNQAKNDEAHYLWRWIGMHAPDLVIDMRSGNDSTWTYPARPPEILKTIQNRLRGISKDTAGEEFLVAALNHGVPSEVGSIAALQSHGKSPLLAITMAIDGEFKTPPSSAARQEINRRIARSPIEVARELAEVYGGKLDRVMYIPSLAVIGRMRLGELTGDMSRLSDAERLAAPFRSGKRESMPARGNGSTLSGHLIFRRWPVGPEIRFGRRWRRRLRITGSIEMVVPKSRCRFTTK